MATQELDYPLSGLKVLDFSRVLAGPFAGRVLCDLGADVVKVEPPDGDITRMWGAVKGGVPGYYHQQNVGKRNICMDLRADGATELVFSLIRECDILIENYRPNVMPRLGFGYEVLREVNPRLIMLSISGFGHHGPESHRPAYAPIIHAETGQLARQANRGNIPFRDLPLSVADTNASLHGLVGLLAAVIQRQTTGLGQHIDIAMIDATVFTDDQIHFALEDSEHTGPKPNEVWQTGAGPVLISAEMRFIWHLFSTQLGIADPADEETPLEEKVALRRQVIVDFLAELDTWEAVEAKMDEINLAWGIVRDPTDIRNQATVAARGTIVEVDDRAGGKRPVTQSPYRFSGAISGVRGSAPHRGEHNYEVLQDWLGSSSEEVQAFAQKGLLMQDQETLG